MAKRSNTPEVDQESITVLAQQPHYRQDEDVLEAGAIFFLLPCLMKVLLIFPEVTRGYATLPLSIKGTHSSVSRVKFLKSRNHPFFADVGVSVCGADGCMAK